MRVNSVNYAMPVKTRSVRFMSNAIAFGNAQAKKYTPFPNLGPVPRNHPSTTIRDEIKELRLDELSGIVSFERESDHWRAHYDIGKAFLPDEMSDEFIKTPELGINFENTYPNFATYWRIKTKEGVQLFADTIEGLCGKEIIQRTLAQLKKRLASLKK